MPREAVRAPASRLSGSGPFTHAPGGGRAPPHTPARRASLAATTSVTLTAGHLSVCHHSGHSATGGPYSCLITQVTWSLAPLNASFTCTSTPVVGRKHLEQQTERTRRPRGNAREGPGGGEGRRNTGMGGAGGHQQCPGARHPAPRAAPLNGSQRHQAHTPSLPARVLPSRPLRPRERRGR